MERQTPSPSANADDVLRDAAERYERYIELSGIARIASQTETDSWLRGWQNATMHGNPIGLTLVTQAPQATAKPCE
jgi:hypothetical protein